MNLPIIDTEEIPCCIICGNTPVIDSFAGFLLDLPEPFSICECRACDLRWLSPRPTSVAYERIYRNEYYCEDVIPENYADTVADRLPQYMQRIDRILVHTGTGASLLDIGAAKGDFVEMARKRGFIADGIEPSQRAREEALRAYGISYKYNSITDVPSESYDVVHLNHVFEHLLDPLNELAHIRRILRSRGMLVIEVPQQFTNIVELRHKILRKNNQKSFSLYSIHHPFFYSPRSLKKIFALAGFQILRLSTWNTSIVRGSWREKVLLFIGDLCGRGDFIEIYLSKDAEKCVE